MQNLSRPALIAGFLAVAGISSEAARGQVIGGVGYPTAPIGNVVAVGQPIVISAPGPVFEGPAAPYSYYAAFPGPARHYVPYGPLDEFAYRGQPYGHPYDRWTWNYLAGYNKLMDRYFYPPVR